MFKRFLSTARLLLAAGLAVAAQQAAAADLVVGSRTEPNSMDPQYTWGQITNQFFYHYLGYLTYKGPDGKLIPGLARKWTAEGENAWLIDMNPEARFSTGAPVTPADVVASYERATNLANSSYKGLFAPVQKYEIVNERTLRIVTKRPYPVLPFMLSQVPVIPRNIAEKATSKDFLLPEFNVSAGPYLFSRYIPGDRLELVANPRYWGPKARWDKVTFRFISETSARVAALLSGAVDMIDGVPPDDATEIARRPGFNVVTTPGERTVFMTYDLSRDITPQITALDGSPLPANPLKDIRVRKALALAINRDAIVQRVLAGLGAPMNQIGSPRQGGFNTALPKLPFDAEGAKKLLAEAGYPNGFAMTVSCPSGFLVNDARICQVVSQMLERIGLKTTVDVQPYAVLAAKIICHCADKPSFFMATWNSSYAGEIGPALTNVLHSYDKAAGKAPWNLGEYANPQLDLLIDKAVETIDDATRYRLEGEAMKIAMDDFAVLPMHLQGVALAARKGLKPTPMSNEYTLVDYVEQTK